MLKEYQGNYDKNYLVSVDQVTINFPKNKYGEIKPASEIDKELNLTKIFGPPNNSKALNHYSEAISYYDGQIRVMWSNERVNQGTLIYFSATGFKAWQNLGKLKGYTSTFKNLIQYLFQENAKFTRLDVAIDVINSNLTVNELHEQLQSKKIIFLDSLNREISTERQKFFGENKVITGITCGARSSDKYLRIYDKKIEQNRANAPNIDLAKSSKSWIRIEGEFKHKAAHAVLLDLKDNDDDKIRQKLIGYVVKQWRLVDLTHKLIPLWKKLSVLSDGEGNISPLEPAIADRLIQELKWFLTGGATGVLYRISKLFGETGKVDFFLFMFDYVDNSNEEKHYCIPNNMSKDLNLIRKQHPKLKNISYYLQQAVKEIDMER